MIQNRIFLLLLVYWQDHMAGVAARLFGAGVAFNLLGKNRTRWPTSKRLVLTGSSSCSALVFFRHVLGRPAVVASDPAKRDWWEGTAGAKAKGFLRNKPGAAWANVYGLEPGTMEGRWPQGSSGVEKVADPS